MNGGKKSEYSVQDNSFTRPQNYIDLNNKGLINIKQLNFSKDLEGCSDLNKSNGFKQDLQNSSNQSKFNDSSMIINADSYNKQSQLTTNNTKALSKPENLVKINLFEDKQCQTQVTIREIEHLQGLSTEFNCLKQEFICNFLKNQPDLVRKLYKSFIKRPKIEKKSIKLAVKKKLLQYSPEDKSKVKTACKAKAKFKVDGIAREESGLTFAYKEEKEIEPFVEVAIESSARLEESNKSETSTQFLNKKHALGNLFNSIEDPTSLSRNIKSSSTLIDSQKEANKLKKKVSGLDLFKEEFIKSKPDLNLKDAEKVRIKSF